MLRPLIVIAIAATVLGAGTWLYCIPAAAQVAAPGTVQPDGSVAGVPTVQPGKELETVQGYIMAAKAAVGAGQWGVLVSILLSAGLAFFSWLLVRSKPTRDKLRDFMPEIAILMAILAYLADALATLPAHAPGAAWWAVIWPALKTGAAAVGLYAFAVKRLWGFYAPRLWAWAGPWILRRLGLAKKEPDAAPETKPLPAPLEPPKP